jgi:Tol biopolymer transport system component
MGALLALAASSHAAFPGVNGKIAFSVSPGIQNFDIYSMNPDTTGLSRLTDDPGLEASPAWSPDGTKLAFSRSLPDGHSTTIVMNADGSGQTDVGSGFIASGGPTWSPDGSRLAVLGVRTGDTRSRIYVMNADGTGITPVTPATAPGNYPDTSAAWSPDGTKIAFDRAALDIFVVNADGTGLRRLTNNGVMANFATFKPDWSPDGTKIAFVFGYLLGDLEIYVMNADGSDVTRLTHDPITDLDPVWSPDGTKILFDQLYDLWIMNADGSGPRPVGVVGLYPDWQPLPPSRFKNGPAFCRALRESIGEPAFTDRYGPGANAFGKCVSASGG